MKKLLLLFSWAFCLLAGAQGVKTEDKLIVSFDPEESEELILNHVPNEEEDEEGAYFTISLEGEQIYTGYEIYIQLPEGMNVLRYANDRLKVARSGLNHGTQKDTPTIYPYTSIRNGKNDYSYEYQHQVSAAMHDGNVLCVTCISTSGGDFLSAEGDLFDVYVQASPYMKPGDVNIEIKSAILVHNEWSAEDQMNHGISYIPSCGSGIIPVSGECNDLPFNVSSANRWSTCVLPFAAAVPEGVKAYTVSSYDAENLKLAESKTMEAYTPYILYSEKGYQGTLSGTVDASGYPEKGYTEGSVLKGAIVAQTVKNGYVMQKQDGVVMFYKIKEGDSFSVPAGKCWLELPAGSSAKSLSFTFEDETGIDTVRPAVKTSDIYLIDGRRVSEPQPGKLYIKGGAKYVKQ